MILIVRDSAGRQDDRLYEREPECGGNAICDVCDECLACYCLVEPCEDGSMDHSWILYTEEDAERIEALGLPND